MKLGLTLAMLLMCQLALSQTLKEKRTKEEMIERVDSLILKSAEGREALSKEDVITACQKINDIFVLLPEHLVAIGSRMNIFDPKILKMEHETKMFLIDIHRRSNSCAVGEIGENLDIGDSAKQLKSMNKKLKKQRKRIKKSDTNYNNAYNYSYEFH